MARIIPPNGWTIDQVRKEYPEALESLEREGDHGVLSIGGQSTRDEDDLVFKHDDWSVPYWWDAVEGCWMDVPWKR